MISAFGVDSSASVPLQLNSKQLRLDSPSGFGDKSAIKRLEKSFFWCSGLFFKRQLQIFFMPAFIGLLVRLNICHMRYKF